jgi:hypothetical protein
VKVRAERAASEQKQQEEEGEGEEVVGVLLKKAMGA